MYYACIWFCADVEKYLCFRISHLCLCISAQQSSDIKHNVNNTKVQHSAFMFGNRFFLIKIDADIQD